MAFWLCVMAEQPGSGIATVCPWHCVAWASLQARHAAHALPHALLLTGEAGTGKRRFADACAAWLLCSAPVAGRACGRCKSCLLVAAGSHPDHLLVVPEVMRADADSGPDPESGSRKRKPSRDIRVDEVRELIGFASRTAQFGGRRVIVIDPAQAMNVNAANALLKTLEEPGAGMLLLLVSDAPAMLAATVRSRCQQIRLPSPTRAEALAWLAPLVGGEARATTLLGAAVTPMRALDLRDGAEDWVVQRPVLGKLLVDVLCGTASAVRFAEMAAKAPEALLMDWLPTLLADAVRIAEGVPAERLRNGDLAADLRRVVDARTTQPLFLLGDDLSRLRQQFHAGAGLSRPLLWEEVMLRWSPRPRSGHP